jgi:arylsulfate sulfotransferase
MRNVLSRCLLRGAHTIFLAAFSIIPSWALSVDLQPFDTSPTPVGSPVTWDASLPDGAEGAMWYRYRVRTPGDDRFRTVRDFSPQSWFKWIPGMAEGLYEIEVTVRNVDSGETGVAVSGYEVASRIVGDSPLVTPTSNELVFLYSAPPCQTGSKMTVIYISAQGRRRETPLVDCLEAKSMNAYLAGLRPETAYTVQHGVKSPDGAVVKGPVLSFQTGPLSFMPASTSVIEKPSRLGKQGVLVQNRLFEFSVATDEEGSVIWYVPETLQFLTRFEAGGYFFALMEDDSGEQTAQLLRLLDIAGNTVLETNAGRINEQLAMLGRNKITSFHHEARKLANGNILVLAATERLLTDVQGSGEVDVIGDMILVLNPDLEVVWAWDAFDHLDVTRKAVLDEKCVPRGGGCPIFLLAQTANDWLHGNSVSLAPDGNIIYSARHQDWVIKIDYAGGNGSGNVLCRLGKGGDFSIVSNDPEPWFSHQHDANFETADSVNRLLLFDNGNTRQAEDPTANSRGQAIDINEETLTATLVLNVDLGAFSLALGSAQKLDNGNYFFNLGWVPNAISQAREVDSSGSLVSNYEIGTQQYRSFRMRDLYTP